MKAKDLTIIIPTLNERDNLGVLLPRLVKEFSEAEIIVSDDGSNESLDISLSGIHVQYYENQEIDLESFAEVKNYLELASKKLVVTNDNTRYYQ